MQKYKLSEIVGGHLHCTCLKQFLKPEINLKKLGVTRSKKAQKYYTVEEIRFIRDAYIKRKESMKYPYYVQVQREEAFKKLENFLTSINNDKQKEQK